MADLDDLKKRLYKEEENFDERMVAPDIEKPYPRRDIPWQDKKEPEHKFRRYVFWGSLAAAGLIIIVVLFFWLGGAKFFQSQDLDINISGDKEIQSGDRSTWHVQITNNNKVVLDDAALTFNFPEGALNVDAARTPATRTRINVGKINPGESVEEVFDAYVFGGRGNTRSVSAVLEYRPSGASAVFAKDSSFDFTIVRSPIAVSFDIPSELRMGQEVNFAVHYISQSDADIDNLSLRLTYPDGFIFESADPKSQDKTTNNIWNLGTLKSKADGVVNIKGVIRGTNLEPKNFKAEIGVLNSSDNSMLSYDESVASVALHSPFIEIGFLTNGATADIYTAQPGETINFTIPWKNNLPSDVKNATLEVKIDGLNFVDFKNLSAENGVYREATKSIVWNASNNSNFQDIPPNVSGEVHFSLRIKDSLPLNSDSLRPVVKLNAQMSPGGVVTNFDNVDVSGSSSAAIQVVSNIQLAAKGFYFGSQIQNSGPLPPQVGQSTTYTVVWSLANTSNDLDNVVVVSSLPPYVDYNDVIIPADSDVSFNRSSGEIAWRVGRVTAGTGFLKPALTLAFQITFNPSRTQIGSSPMLINKTNVTGRDTFTNSPISSGADSINISLPDDTKISNNQKTVSP